MPICTPILSDFADKYLIGKIFNCDFRRNENGSFTNRLSFRRIFIIANQTCFVKENFVKGKKFSLEILSGTPGNRSVLCLKGCNAGHSMQVFPGSEIPAVSYAFFQA